MFRSCVRVIQQAREDGGKLLTHDLQSHLILNQSSTDRCCSDALIACSTGRACTVRLFIASGYNCASTLLCAKLVPSQRAVFSSGSDGRESRAEPRGAGTQCNFKMTAEEASCASEGDDSEFETPNGLNGAAGTRGRPPKKEGEEAEFQLDLKPETRRVVGT
ncbi:hypothetical protein EYF80_014684 [Liparis tanakae]|uniref:Uncharacterized protein n=1 Tax=Liparis tanakae TaxID=230148 RepID=A0A4Z2IBM2_9TELE|nr:hypothetical protein EYF80_014684 [Liparis tanakae]